MLARRRICVAGSRAGRGVLAATQDRQGRGWPGAEALGGAGDAHKGDDPHSHGDLPDDGGKARGAHCQLQRVGWWNGRRCFVDRQHSRRAAGPAERHHCHRQENLCEAGKDQAHPHGFPVLGQGEPFGIEKVEPLRSETQKRVIGLVAKHLCCVDASAIGSSEKQSLAGIFRLILDLMVSFLLSAHPSFCGNAHETGLPKNVCKCTRDWFPKIRACLNALPQQLVLAQLCMFCFACPSARRRCLEPRPCMRPWV